MMVKSLHRIVAKGQSFYMKQNELLLMPYWLYRTRPCVSNAFSTTSTSLGKKLEPLSVDEMPIYQYVGVDSKRVDRVYVWGIAHTGALGVKQFVKPDRGSRAKPKIYQAKPFRLKFADKYPISDVACGYGFTVFIPHATQTRYKLFGTGVNTESQIGFHETRKGSGSSLQLLAQPAPIELPLLDQQTKVTQVACGRSHTIVITDKEGAFSLGSNKFGQCGRPIVEGEKYSSNPTVHKVRDLPDNVVHMVCQEDHSLFLTEQGHVYGCGSSPCLGEVSGACVPALLKGDIQGEKIVNMASSHDCLLATNDKGDVFGCGNSQYYQLPYLMDNSTFKTPTYLKMSNVGPVKHSAVSRSLCAVVNSKGQVFTWGFGLLGKGPNTTLSPTPTQIPEVLFGRNELNPDAVVDRVAAGHTYLAAITNKGDLYTWGLNKTAALGLGNTKDFFFPFKVVISSEVRKIACGFDHTIVLTKSYV